MSARERIGRAILALALVGAALPAVGRLYGPGWLVPVLGVAVLAVAVDLVVRLVVPRGHGPLLAVVHVFLAGLATSVLVRPGLDGAIALVGAGDGVARLLSGVPPVDARGPELAAAVLATWLVAALTAAVLARRRASLVAAVPAIALFGAALALGDPARVLADRSTAALVAAVALLLVVAGRPDRATWASVVDGVGASSTHPSRVLRPLGALVVLVVATAVALAVTPSLPGLAQRDRVDVRSRVVPPVEVLLGENPLDTVALRRAGRDRPVRFTADVDLPAGADGRLYWRLTVLDDVGPGGWRRTPAGFTRAGRSLGPPPAGTTAGRAVASARLELGEAPAGLPLLPTLDRPLTASPSGLAVDPRTGELAVPAGDARPDTLELEAAIPTYGPGELARTPAVAVPVPADLPPAAASRARLAVAGVGNDFQRLSALKASVEDDPLLRLDVVRTGNTADATIADLLRPAGPQPTGAEDEGGDLGEDPGDGSAAVRPANAGQVAASFALLARSQGFDARLVVGYLTPVSGSSASLRVTDDQLTAWTEIRFEGLGWVPIRVAAPAGGGGEGGAAPPDAEGTSVVDDAAEQQERPDSPTTTPESPADPGPKAPAAPVDAASGTSSVPFAVGALVAVVAALLAVGPLRRARRRSLRRRGDDDDRTLGAWAEVVDELAASSAPVGTDLSRPALAASAEGLLGPELAAELAWLARHADRVAFGGASSAPTPPPVPSVADRAWLVPARLARELQGREGFLGRARRWVRWPRRPRTSVRSGRAAHGGRAGAFGAAVDG